MLRAGQQRSFKERLHQGALYPATPPANGGGLQRRVADRLYHPGRRPAISDRENLELAECAEWRRRSIRVGVDSVEQARALGPLELCLVNQRGGQCPHEAGECRRSRFTFFCFCFFLKDQLYVRTQLSASSDF